MLRNERLVASVFHRLKALAAHRYESYFRAMIEAGEIERMSRTEKVQAMELLWRSLASEPSQVESPAWHKKILAGRLAKVTAGQGEFITISQLKKRLAKRRK